MSELKVHVPEVVRLSPITMEVFMQHISQKKLLELQMELTVWRDLVKQIDPEHLYVFSPEYNAFLKTPMPKEREDESLDQHKELSAMAVIDGSFKPTFKQ
jgi:hypothetical protein